MSHSGCGGDFDLAREEAVSNGVVNHMFVKKKKKVTMK